MPAIVTMGVLAKPICSLISGNFDYTSPTAEYVNAPWVLVILASMMLTYSLGDIIYGQILLPMKKEKYYLIAMLSGTLLNVVLSIVLGKYAAEKVSWMSPAMGVAIGTAVTDLLMIIFLVSLTWKWVKEAIFNMNTLKLLIANVIMLGVSLLLNAPLSNLWINLNVSDTLAAVYQMLSIVAIDAIIYLVFLALTKEKLVSSFLRKKEKTSENA